jgi:probable phosphoglycerate mutase
MSGQPLEKAEREGAKMRGAKMLLGGVILCRHGATDHHPDRFYEIGEGPSLNEEGVAQANALARWVSEHGGSIDALYVSPSARTRQTAAPVERALGLSAVAIEAFTERSVGGWNGRLVDEIRREEPEAWQRWKRDPVAFAPPEGESLDAFTRRIETAISDLLTRHPGRVALVVTHVGPIRAALGSALSCPPEFGKRFVIEPGSVTRIDYTTCWPNLVCMGVRPT